MHEIIELVLEWWVLIVCRSVFTFAHNLCRSKSHTKFIICSVFVDSWQQKTQITIYGHCACSMCILRGSAWSWLRFWPNAFVMRSVRIYLNAMIVTNWSFLFVFSLICARIICRCKMERFDAAAVRLNYGENDNFGAFSSICGRIKC